MRWGEGAPRRFIKGSAGGRLERHGPRRGDVRRERSRREIFWCAAGDRRRLGDGRRLPRFACSFRAARRDRPGAKRTMSRARRRGKRRHKKRSSVGQPGPTTLQIDRSSTAADRVCQVERVKAFTGWLPAWFCQNFCLFSPNQLAWFTHSSRFLSPFLGRRRRRRPTSLVFSLCFAPHLTLKLRHACVGSFFVLVHNITREFKFTGVVVPIC